MTTERKARPIIMSGESVRAILAGRKTQTRRVVKPQPFDAPERIGVAPLDGGGSGFSDDDGEVWRCPYGAIGDLLWVRETWSVWRMGGYWEPRECDEIEGPIDKQSFDENGYELCFRASEPDAVADRWRSPLYMPRWASRLTLRITDVRVERVQDISELDAEREGVERGPSGRGVYPGTGAAQVMTYRDGYRLAWDALNAKRGYGWDANPWVWALTFEVVP